MRNLLKANHLCHPGILALELFGNLIVTFLGIFTPLLIILINISKDGIVALEKIHKATNAVFDAEIKARAGAATIDTKQMKAYISGMEGTLKNHKKSLQLLRPRRQFVRTFCSLMASFLLLEVYIAMPPVVIIRDKAVSTVPVLCGSIFLFGFALFIIWQILSTLIKVREALIDRKYYDDGNVISQPNQVQHG